MGLKELRKKLKNLTFGVFTTSIDLVLFTIFILIEAGHSPAEMRSLLKSQKIFSKLFLKRKDRIIRDAIYRAQRKGWIEIDLNLTKEGKKRLKGLLPEVLSIRKWDGNWYLVIFDIPEKMKRIRNILRETLKRLGFAQLQASVWISPFNYFGVVKEIVKEYKLNNYVILAITDKLGEESSKALAERLWNLEKINLEYAEIISQYKKAKEEEKFWLKFKYYDTLKKDPQLPEELLPDRWYGKNIHLLFKKRPSL